MGGGWWVEWGGGRGGGLGVGERAGREEEEEGAEVYAQEFIIRCDRSATRVENVGRKRG